MPESQSEEIEEKLNIPAPERKNYSEEQHSLESAISKYNLSEENEILDTRFRYDNVDSILKLKQHVRLGM